MKEHADIKLLSPKCADDLKGVLGGLCIRGDQGSWYEAHRKGAGKDYQSKGKRDLLQSYS